MFSLSRCVVKKGLDLEVFSLWEKLPAFCRGGPWMFPLGNSKLNVFFEQVCAPVLKFKLTSRKITQTW